MAVAFKFCSSDNTEVVEYRFSGQISTFEFSTISWGACVRDFLANNWGRALLVRLYFFSVGMLRGIETSFCI